MSINNKHDTSLVRTPSRESLVVHPLLLNVPDNAKYVPYTPRQRQSTTTASKHHLANLRTAAQSIGLDPTSVGWAILEKISYEGDTSDEWSEIWSAITKARATLLLPSVTTSGNDTITPELVHDHLVLSNTDDTAVVTLSGLRGHLANDAITFRSALHRSTKSFQSLWSSRATSLDALPPLPVYPPESSYPSFTISAFSATLPLPSRPTKPPLSLRPGTRNALASPRLSMPFASLFAQRPSTPPLPTMTTNLSPSSLDTDTTIDVSAFVVDTVVSRTDIATAIISAVKGEIAIALNDHPPWLVERVHAFALPYLPFVKLPAGKKRLQDIGGNANRVVYAVNPALDTPDQLADRFQAFYRSVESELRLGNHGDSGPQNSDGARVSSNEAQIRDVLETIETTLCTLLYDRLFLPSTSDDASHNQALSSRIAALNMLDLGLEHLDVDIGDANHAEVDAIVRTCGQALAQLDLSARSPHEKAAVLVSVHKLVVEGLSKVPPIRLKSRDNTDDVPMKDLSSPSEATEYPNAISVHSPSTPAIHLSTSPDHSSVLQHDPPPPTSSPVSGDVLLPILIFSVVKANPSKLVSHLLFTQRFRNQTFGGEESYCLVNLMAVAEFLEKVDLGALGLGESEKKVLSTADLTPISIARPLVQGEEHLASLRGRVGQSVDALAGSANKVISGVVDTSTLTLDLLLSLASRTPPTVVRPPDSVVTREGRQTGLDAGSGLTGTSTSTSTSAGAGPSLSETDAAPWSVRPALGLLRLAGLTAALPSPGKGRGQNGHGEEEGQRELLEVVSPMPPSLRSHQNGREGEQGYEDQCEDAQGEEEDEGSEEDEQEGEEGETEGEGEGEEVHDTRGIKSFESMLSDGRARTRRKQTPLGTGSGATTRRRRLTSLTDRLTHGVAEMSRGVQGGPDAQRVQAVATSTWGRLSPPNRRFVECTEQDLCVSEVGELLGEYQRLVEAVRIAGGFQE